jgi:suppressor for copper-sensitivity B
MTGTSHRRFFANHGLALGIAALIASALLVSAPPAAAQIAFDSVTAAQAGGGPPEDVVKAKAEFTPPMGDKPGRLFITAEVADGWHIYSITQKPGGPVKSKIKLDASKDFKLTGDFKPFPNFEKHVEAAFNNLEVEQHEGKVVWYAPLEVAPGVDLKQLKITGKLSYQACNDSSCLPPDALKFEARLGKGVDVDKKTKDKKPDGKK